MRFTNTCIFFLLLIPFVTVSTVNAENTKAIPQEIKISSADDFFDETLNDLEEELTIAKQLFRTPIILYSKSYH